MTTKPTIKPSSPNFSCGPCNKHPGFSDEILKTAALGRSHRSKLGRDKLKQVIDETRELLDIPSNYHIGIIPGSDTGTVEAALWSLLGPREVDVFAWEAFGHIWRQDCVNQLSSLKVNSYELELENRGKISDLSKANPNNDIVFTWNGTSSGVMVPNADWISDDRTGLVICDAVSSAGAIKMPWNKLDATTFSWQKVLGGEAAHGILVLSPRAIERLETHKPTWPIPKVFRLADNCVVNFGIFDGITLNTPSMLCVEDVLYAMEWARSIGGVGGLHDRTMSNFNILSAWVESSTWLDFLCQDKSIRSPTSVCLKLIGPLTQKLTVDEQHEFCKKVSLVLEIEGVGFDVNAYARSPPGFRIWCGPTVESNDIAILTTWLDWAMKEVIKLHDYELL